MRYIKFVCSNGYCGCDEEFYDKYEDNISDDMLDKIAIDILENHYGFFEPDGRFLEHASDFDDTNYEEYDDDYDEYQSNLEVSWEEITKEDYEEENV